MARDSGNPIRRRGEDLDFLPLLLLLLLLLMFNFGSNSSVSSGLFCRLPLLGDTDMLCDTCVGDTFCDVSLCDKIFDVSSSSMSSTSPISNLMGSNFSTGVNLVSSTEVCRNVDISFRRLSLLGESSIPVAPSSVATLTPRLKKRPTDSAEENELLVRLKKKRQKTNFIALCFLYPSLLYFGFTVLVLLCTQF